MSSWMNYPRKCKKKIKQNNKQCLCTLLPCVGICANTIYYQKASIKRPKKHCKPHEEQNRQRLKPNLALQIIQSSQSAFPC